MNAISDTAPCSILVTGGAGFIGSNLIAHLLKTSNSQITICDNLTGRGARENLAWLGSQAARGRLRFIRADVRRPLDIATALARADVVYHLASRWAAAPDARTDFDVNVNGTLNVVDGARKSSRNPVVVLASTSRVYGPLANLHLETGETRFHPVDCSFRGIDENATLDLDSDYSRSTTTADQCFREAVKRYGLRGVVLRLDAVAGPRQFAGRRGEWVARIVYSILDGRPVRVRGTGLEVYDLLHVSDVVEALTAATAYIGVTAGKAYNVGGGLPHSVSVHELIEIAQRVCHRGAPIVHENAAPRDRTFYCADSRNFSNDTGWMVRRSIEDAVRDLSSFWLAHFGQFWMVARPTDPTPASVPMHRAA